MKIKFMILTAVFLVLFSYPTLALTVSVSQTNADPGEVMKGRTFVVTVSGWSGSCSVATINFANCPSCSLTGESQQKTITQGTQSVSWTTVVANQKATAQKISVTVSGGCTLQEGESSSFDVVLPPSLDVSISPTSVSVDAGSTFTVNINLKNLGETTARSINVQVSGAGMSVQSGCLPISEISEGGNAAQSCVIKATSAGTHTLQFSFTSANAETVTKSISVSVSGAEEGVPTEGVPGVGLPPTALQNVSKKFWFSPPGLLNNTKLLSAIEKVLAKGKLSDVAKQNLIDIANVIKSDLNTTRKILYADGKSRIVTKMKYLGSKRVKNFMVFETLPKGFAENANNVTVIARNAVIEIVEEDPAWLFLYPELNYGDEITIEYEVSGEKDSSVLDSITTEIYAESLEEVVPPVCEEGKRRCYGNELQECRDNNWITIEKCEYGCEDNKCKPKPEEIIRPEMNVWTVVIIIFIIAIIAVILLKRK